MECWIEDCNNLTERCVCDACYEKYLSFKYEPGVGSHFVIEGSLSFWMILDKTFTCKKCRQERCEMLSSTNEISEDGRMIFSDQQNTRCIYCRIYKAGEHEYDGKVLVCANCICYGNCNCDTLNKDCGIPEIPPEKRLEAKLSLIKFIKREERRIYQEVIWEFIKCWCFYRNKSTESHYLKSVPKDVMKIIVEKIRVTK